jgi:hypothetical protein
MLILFLTLLGCEFTDGDAGGDGHPVLEAQKAGWLV